MSDITTHARRIAEWAAHKARYQAMPHPDNNIKSALHVCDTMLDFHQQKIEALIVKEPPPEYEITEPMFTIYFRGLPMEFFEGED